MFHKKLLTVHRMSGFAVENGKSGDIIKVLCRSFVTSDENDFYNYVDAFVGSYLRPFGILDDFVHNFLILHHADLSADVYVNDLPINIECLSKRSVEKGEYVYENDIADLRRLRFEGIEIKKTDNIIFCFKKGWRFGLFFDLTCVGNSETVIDVNKLYFDLGSYYKKLFFHHLFGIVESGSHFEEMKKDGWFPYVELLSSDYAELSNAYTNKFNFSENISKLLNKFTKERIEKVSSRWWKNPIFAEKKTLIETGIDGYLQDTQKGYISCIKTLYSEIEGILAFLYLGDTKKYTNSSSKLLNLLKEKGFSRTRGYNSALLPDIFCDYLQNYLFPQFDLLNGAVALSRHTSSHGVADACTYTKEKALQAILILDQIYFFLPPPNEK